MAIANKAAESAFDHLIIGGAVAGASCAWLLLRENPSLRVAIVEKSEAFKRRVGESTVEVSAAFLGRKLGLSAHLNREHLVKQGLRFYFAGEQTRRVEDCSEVGSIYNVRLPGYQLDRSILDEAVLQKAVAAGAVLFRPAKVIDFQLEEGGMQEVEVDLGEGNRRTLTARWIVDASGLAAVLGRRLGLIERNTRHPISSVWARFRGAANWDADEDMGTSQWRGRVLGLRDTATNHLVGRGYWIWVIPLRDGDYSVGVVYDQRLVEFPGTGGRLGDRLTAFLRAHPAGNDLLKHAEWIEGDVHARSNLPYRATRLMGDGWALVGDAAGFLDPFYSPGLDWTCFTACATAEMLAHRPRGALLQRAIRRHNKRFTTSYDRWFEALYEDKYYYMGDLELLDLAFRLDLASYYLGVVARPLKGLPDGWTLPPFAHPRAGGAFRLVRSYNRSLARIGRKRMERGQFGRRNHGEFRPFNSFQFTATLPLRFLGLLVRWRWLVFREWVETTLTRRPVAKPAGGGRRDLTPEKAPQGSTAR